MPNVVNEPERVFKGVWIPAEVWLRDDISPTEKCLLAEISSLDDGTGCYARNEHLAKLLQVSEGTLANLLSRLRKKGLVKTVSFDGRDRRISVAYESEVCLHEKMNASRKSEVCLPQKNEVYVHENVKTPSRKSEVCVHENVSSYIIKRENTIENRENNNCAIGGLDFISFETFWANYPSNCPRKVQKAQCKAYWQKEKLDDKAEAVMKALKAWKASNDWTRNNGQYICAPLVWLRKQAWLDYENTASCALNASNCPSKSEDDKSIALKRWRFFSAKIRGFVIDGRAPWREEIEICEDIADQYPEEKLPRWDAERKEFV